MRATRSEQALRRILAWLRWSGQELDPQLEHAVLQALSEAVAAGEVDLFDASLRRIKTSGVLQQGISHLSFEGCAPAPPLRRSSIRYGRY